MKYVNVVVEGETEAEFIESVLNPYLNPKGIFLTGILLTTKRVKQGRDFKGGVTTYGKVRNDIVRVLQDKNAALVTTMIDFYGLPTDFPKYKHLPSGSCYQRVEFLEKAFDEDIGIRNFLPYLMIHEFEAILFVSPAAIVDAFNQPDKLQALTAINKPFGSPEEINEEHPPSKRVLQIFKEYNKPFYGAYIAGEIGVDEIRSMCPHFDQWITKLEALVS